MGRVSYFETDYYHAIMWLNQTLKIMDRDGGSDAMRALVLDFLSFSVYKVLSWWRHQTETFSALLVFCEGNPPVTPDKGQWRGALMFSLICA